MNARSVYLLSDSLNEAQGRGTVQSAMSGPSLGTRLAVINYEWISSISIVAAPAYALRWLARLLLPGSGHSHQFTGSVSGRLS